MSSFPFLKISKDFNVDYGDVLTVADAYHKRAAINTTAQRDARLNLENAVGPAIYDLDAAIWGAVEDFQRLQRGA